MVKTIIICDSCGSEGGIAFIVGDGQYRHICDDCLSSNWSEAFTGTPHEKEMLIIFDMLLGKNTNLYQYFSKKDRPAKTDYESLFTRILNKWNNGTLTLSRVFDEILKEDKL